MIPASIGRKALDLLGRAPDSVRQFLFVAAGIAVVIVLGLTWPVGVLFTVACLVRFVAARVAKSRDSKVARAVVKVTLPYVCGLGCVSLLQLAFNLWRLSAHSVSAVEEWFIAQHDRIGLLNELTWWQYVGILALLAAASVAAPRLRLVRRFVRAVGAAETVSGVLATVTAFSFVTGAIGGRYLEDIETRYQAHLADKVKDRGKVTAEATARRAIAQSMARFPPISVSILGAVETQLHEADPRETATDQMLDKELGEQVHPEENTAPSSPLPPAPMSGKAHGSELLRLLDGEDGKMAAAEAEDRKAHEAIEAGLDRIADNASDALRGKIRGVLEQAFGEGVSPLVGALLDLGNDLTAEYLAQVREPLMKRANDYCRRLADRIARLGRPEAVAADVRARTKSDALDEALRLEGLNPGIDRFERLAKDVFPQDLGVRGDRTRTLADAIEVAVDLTPSAGAIDWRSKLPPANAAEAVLRAGEGLPRPAPARIRAFDRGPAPSYMDPALQRVIDGLGTYRGLEQRRMAEALELKRDREIDDKVRERERIEIEPHGP